MRDATCCRKILPKKEEYIYIYIYLILRNSVIGFSKISREVKGDEFK